MASNKSNRQQAVEGILRQTGQTYRSWKTETLRHAGTDLIAGLKSPFTDLVIKQAEDELITDYISKHPPHVGVKGTQRTDFGPQGGEENHG
ncbi:hypothetical protein [Schleiferilactobacillus harbinensis]|uniref:Uncharacterized protein n=1 Tax=Schleiferilactobacillus harbinensis TaxID=304207 RepID=A0A5P8M5N6_9LACO|nr:hypothetical protein [Schleiferilactobacillus harbinensis]QFR23647.1 hypothetical protein D1010_09625 [Schleiferilactobacillus harbinensis]